MPLETILQPSPREEINSGCIARMYVSVDTNIDGFSGTSFYKSEWVLHSIASQSPDGARVAMSTEAGQIYIFDLESNSLTATYTSHAMSVRALSWSPDCQVCTLNDLPNA